ncbi:MAG TPA: DUF456 domain-containing protein [Nocardioidaceae bacterium]|nr:DUF456 domain-containing protein [Nocardioidaceae bacterium]
MSLIGNLLVGLAIAIGLVGVVVPILPGTLLILVAIVVWAVAEGGVVAWTACGIAIGILVAGQALKYAVPGRRLSVHGVPASTLIVAGLLGVIGFFVVPVVGLVIGFVGGVYVAEAARLHDVVGAWRSTMAALTAVGLSIAIELVGGLLAAAVWAIGVLATTG